MAANAGRNNVSLQLLIRVIVTPVVLLTGAIGASAASESGIAVLLANHAVGWTQPKLVMLATGYAGDR